MNERAKWWAERVVIAVLGLAVGIGIGLSVNNAEASPQGFSSGPSDWCGFGSRIPNKGWNSRATV